MALSKLLNGSYFLIYNNGIIIKIKTIRQVKWINVLKVYRTMPAPNKQSINAWCDNNCYHCKHTCLFQCKITIDKFFFWICVSLRNLCMSIEEYETIGYVGLLLFQHWSLGHEVIKRKVKRAGNVHAFQEFAMAAVFTTLRSVAWADWHITAPDEIDDLSIRRTALQYLWNERLFVLSYAKAACSALRRCSLTT